MISSSLPRVRTRVAAVLLCTLLFPSHVRAEASSAAPPDRRGAWIVSRLERIKLPPKLKHAVDSRMRLWRGRSTRLADGLQSRLPGRLQPVFGGVRLLSPATISAFGLKKFREDPVFLAGFGAVSTVVNYLKVPALVALGLNPMAALLIKELTDTPISLGVIAWRQHHRRQDRSRSLGGTVRQLAGEYRDFAAGRRADNRAFMQEREAQLRGLGQALR